jgi:hypothetical protein
MGEYTKAGSGQRLGTHSRSNRQERNNRRAAFYMRSVPRCYNQGTKLGLSQLLVENQLATGVCEERTRGGSKGILTVRAVTRKRLVTD